MMKLTKTKIFVPNIFQAEALKALRDTEKDSGVVVMPTGTGKTFLAALWYHEQLKKNPKATLLFLCHNRDILSQANEKEFKKTMGDDDGITKEEIIEQLQKYKTEHGKFPTMREGRRVGLISDNTLRKYFGSYGKALVAAGGTPNKNTFLDVNKDRIMADYKAMKEKMGTIPFEKEMNDAVPYNFHNAIKQHYRMYYSKFVNIMGDLEAYKARNKSVDRSSMWKGKRRRNDAEVIKQYEALVKKLGRHPTKEENRKAGLPTEMVLPKYFGVKNLTDIRKLYDKQSNIEIINNYTPSREAKKTYQKHTGTGSIKNKWKKQFHTTENKSDIRTKIISHIEDGSTILILESPELSAIKEIEKQKKKPKQIIIPNNQEFKQLIEALKSYKTSLNIKVVNTSALQYLTDTEEKIDYLWLDYYGAFGSYCNDLDVLLEKFSNVKLILTYNTFDPMKEDQSYYYVAVIDRVLEKAKGKVRLMKDISYRYKDKLYNIGFDIASVES